MKFNVATHPAGRDAWRTSHEEEAEFEELLRLSAEMALAEEVDEKDQEDALSSTWCINLVQMHYQDMDSFRHVFATLQHPTDTSLSPACIIYHLKWLSNVTSAYFKAQKEPRQNLTF